MTFPHKINWLFPILFVLYEISTYLSNDMYLPALPEMMRDLNLNTTHAQLTVTMWFLGSAATPLIMGGIAEHFGRRQTLLTGGVIYVISTVLCALSTNEFTLLIPRIIEGAMISSMMVAGYAVIHESYDQKVAIRILAIIGGISVLAPAIGPILGAILLLVGNWRWIFWAIALYSALTLFFLYLYMPETLPIEKRSPLHFKNLFADYWQVLANKNFLLLLAILGLSTAGFIAWIAASSLLIIDSFHYSEISYGWMQAGVFFAHICGCYLINKLIQTQEAQRLVNIGLFITLIGGLFIALATWLFPETFMLFLIGMVIYSFGSAISFAPLNRLIIETSDKPMGIRVALFTTALMGCGVLGSSIMSVVYNGSSISVGAVITICIVLACFLRLHFLKRSIKIH